MSKTIENLKAGFAGESQARNMYGFFAEVARKEGYLYIAKLFEETADNERRHAKDQFRKAGLLGDTVANLKEAIAGENHETTDMYPTFAKEAREEGEDAIAILFDQIGKVEADHRDRYKKLLEMVENGTVYKRDEPVEWKCSVCGFRHTATEPPPKCPCCKHAAKYFEPSDMTSF